MVIKMKILKIGIAVFGVTVLSVNTTPECTYIDSDQFSLKCITDGQDYVLNKGLFSNVSSEVTNIYLKGCNITDIQCDAFSELPDLNLLSLIQNKMHELKPCVFSNLNELRYLCMKNNKISVLPSDAFALSNEMTGLNLDGNELKTLEPDVFDRLVKLKLLNLSNNGIDGKHMSSRIFANNKVLDWLNLSRNNMSAAPEDLLQSFQILGILDLDHCFLTRVPSFATKNNLKTLKSLHLSWNRISSLDDPTTFINLDNLKYLNLDGNLIANIVDNVFTPLRKLEHIYLNHNKLKTISGKLFQDMPKLVKIDLSYNDIEMIDLASFRNTPMESLNLSENKLSHVPANFYDTLIIFGGNLREFFFGNNLLQCACLREILQEVKTHNVNYDSAVYDGNRPVCFVTDSYMACKRG